MKYRGYVPNPSAAGLAFVLPQTQYGLAMVIGATGAHFWRKRNPTHFEGCAFGASTLFVTLLTYVALAAGMLAGEGIGGVVQAVLQVAGVAGEGFGTVAGCPQGGC